MPKHDEHPNSTEPMIATADDGERDPRWDAVIDQILAMSRTIPDDVDGVGAVQVAAQLIVEIEHRISVEQLAVLYGACAMLSRYAKAETMARLTATASLDRIRAARPGPWPTR